MAPDDGIFYPFPWVSRAGLLELPLKTAPMDT